jgi:hypothetical protein
MYHYNLLPKATQTKTKRWIILKQVTVGIAVINIFLVGSSLVLWNANNGLRTLIQSVQAQAQQTIEHRAARGQAYDIDEVNQQILLVSGIQAQHANILALNQEIVGVIPTGVTLSRIAVDFGTKKIALNGSATTRESFQGFRDLLQSSNEFTVVSFPFEALTKPTDIDFQVDVSFQPHHFLYAE